MKKNIPFSWRACSNVSYVLPEDDVREDVQVFLREATHCSLELHRNAAAKVRREKKIKGAEFSSAPGRFFFGAGFFFLEEAFFLKTLYALQDMNCNVFVAILFGMTLSNNSCFLETGSFKTSADVD